MQVYVYKRNTHLLPNTKPVIEIFHPLQDLRCCWLVGVATWVADKFSQDYPYIPIHLGGWDNFDLLSPSLPFASYEVLTASTYDLQTSA